MIFRACQFEFRFPRPALVMGILNVTPDSFYDQGRYFTLDGALTRAHQMIAQGADILDIGGESTRPGAPSVSEEEELRRVMPVIKALAKTVSIPLSIDTIKPAVARAALAAGASIINDVAANREENPMARLAAETGAGYVLMHMQGTPKTMQENPVYADVVKEVSAFFQDRLGRLRAAGLKPEQVVLDVGIGFGKTLEHNLQLLAGLRSFTNIGRPLLLGASRKSFISKLLGVGAAERLPPALAVNTLALQAGVGLFRTHDVAETIQALRMAEAILARS